MVRANRFAAVALVALLGVGGGVGSASAQTTATASVDVLASVIGISPLTAAGVNNLNFRDVTAGTPKTITNLADAARFAVSGEASTPVTVSYTLPTVLSGAGGATVPITFGAADGLLWSSYPAAHTTFNPNAPLFTTLGAGGDLLIGVLGTVSAPIGSTTGSYTGTITLTVAY